MVMNVEISAWLLQLNKVGYLLVDLFKIFRVSLVSTCWVVKS